MAWYYVEDGKQAGPVDDAGLGQLVAAGRVRPDTLVWREGMAKWEAYGKVFSGAPTAATSGTAVCVNCGSALPVSSLVKCGDDYVCGACKDIYFQRIREGTTAAGGLRYAGFWIRFAAKFIDGIILWVVNWTIQKLFGATAGAAGMEQAPTPGAMVGMILGMFGLMWLLMVAAQLAYYVFFVGKFAATPGKMACGLRIVTPEGGQVTYGRAVGRFFAEWLSGMILLIGYIMAGFDEEKRALHDRICATRVVYK